MCFPYVYWDFEDSRLLIQHIGLVFASCSSGQRFAIGFLQTPCYQDALAESLLLTPRRAGTEDFHLQQCALSGALDKNGTLQRPRFKMLF